MHAEDVPVIFKFAAEHHAPARGAKRWRFNGVVIQAPNHVTHGALILHAHRKMGARGATKVLFPEMIGSLVPSTQFAAGRTQDEIRIETRSQPVSVRVVEGF